MKTVNFKNENFLTFDDQLLKNLSETENKIRRQFQTSGKHYSVSELLSHNGKRFFNLWNEEEFPTYMKENGGKEAKEFRGLYAFASERDEDLHYDYVGISRGIRQRFQWHASGTIKNHATWAWLMLKQENKVDPNASKEEIKKLLKAKQEEVIHRCLFTFVPIETDMMLHVAEIYCANHLRTHWNSFRTH